MALIDANGDGLDDATGLPMPITPAATSIGGTYDPNAPSTAAPMSGATAPLGSGTWPNGLPRTSYGSTLMPDSVYAWGPTPYAPNPHQANALSAGRNQGGEPVESPKIVSGIDAVTTSIVQLANGDPKQLAAIQKQLHQMGALDSGYTKGSVDPATLDAVQGFLDYASQLNANGDRRTWDKILAQTAASVKKNNKGVDDGPFTGTRTATSTSSNVKLLSPTAAKRLAEQAYTELLGGTPDPGQLAEFRAAVDRVANNNPTVTSGTTSTTYKEGIVTDRESSSTSKGGYDATQVAIDKARADPEYAEYQAAGPMFAALVSAISAPVGE